MKHARATSSVWSELENVPAPSRGRGLGLRFLPGGRSFLSSTLCFLPHRPEVAESHPCECDALAHRCLGSATVTRGTPSGQTPTYLIRENDRKFASHFARVATTSGIKVLRTPYRTRPRKCSLRTFSGEREARMPGSFPNLP